LLGELVGVLVFDVQTHTQIFYHIVLPFYQ
jgi:hypothetical protein